MKCIFCDLENNAKAVEHIVPESFGNTLYISAKGSICDNCNNRFSKFEQEALSNTISILQRAIAAVETKRGRPVNGKVDGLIIKGNKVFQERVVEIDGIEEKHIGNVDPKSGTFELIVQGFDNNEVSVSKLLLKMGLESMFRSQRLIYKKYNFTQLKELLTGNAKDWPFVTSLWTYPSFKSIPRMDDKVHLKKIRCYLKYREINENTLLFEFYYGGIQMVLNLIDRNLDWIKDYDEKDEHCYVYPRHYQKFFPPHGTKGE